MREYKKRMFCRLLCLILVFLLLAGAFPVRAKAPEGALEPPALKAYAAVLMDGQTGRILYGKKESQVLPMASTTKIITCILALEHGNPEDLVEISPYAASMPQVRLGARAGESYHLKDLLHALMLESFNDAAVAIAEYIADRGPEGSLVCTLCEAGRECPGGVCHEVRFSGMPGRDSVRSRSREESKEKVWLFASLMNQKARELGCADTCFITPNGLDATVKIQDGTVLTHSTTAADLAEIMRYCIGGSDKRKEFLEVTRAPSVTFQEASSDRTFSCNNHNAYLNMREGALTGKTGFTSGAGYCYIGVVEKDGKQLIAALLACGWPPHKTWKWRDMESLMNYAFAAYESRSVGVEEYALPALRCPGGDQDLRLRVQPRKIQALAGEGEQFKISCYFETPRQLPVAEGERVGALRYYLGGELICEFPVCTENAVALSKKR